MANRWNLENTIETLMKLKPNTKPQWGSMSAQRMVEHLTDTLAIATGRNPQPLLIPEDKINDIEYVEKCIIENRNYSVNNRKEILEYSKQFDWVNVIKSYYIPNIQKVIKKQKN